MNKPGDLSDLLADPQTKAYLLQLLESDLPNEAKLEKLQELLSDLFAGQSVRAAASPTLSSNTLPFQSDPARLVQDIDTALRRAVRRMARSQHKDGGWGPFVEQSSVCHTAYALLFLNAARETLGASVGREVEDLIPGGMRYLESHPERWAVEAIATTASMSMYDVSLMIRCFYRAGRAHLRREAASRVYRGIDRLSRSQNEDGGWDANVWGYEVLHPIHIWSEVAATSAALQAMAETYNDRFRGVMEKGIRWLAVTQNPDGSWSNGSAGPYLPAFQVEGCPSMVTTCTAVQGILSGRAVDISMRPYSAHLDRAVDWLCQQISPVLERQDQRTGLGWGFTPADYENICLALETLVRLPGPEHPLLTPCASWLVYSQRRQADDLEDGSWVLGHTARIGLALAAYYRRAKEDAPSEQMPWVL